MANFVLTLNAIYNGALADELNDKLTEVVRAAEATGKVGSIGITLKIKTKGNSGQVEITPAVTAKIPEHERGTALMFATPEGNLQLQDPRQQALDLKEAMRPKEKPLKQVGA